MCVGHRGQKRFPEGRALGWVLQEFMGRELSVRGGEAQGGSRSATKSTVSRGGIPGPALPQGERRQPGRQEPGRGWPGTGENFVLPLGKGPSPEN